MFLIFNKVNFKWLLVAGNAQFPQVFTMPFTFPAGAATAPIPAFFMLRNHIQAIGAFALNVEPELPLVGIGQCDIC